MMRPSDVLPKEVPWEANGVTRSGAKVYKEDDGMRVVHEKAMNHVMNAMNPGILPVRVPVGAESWCYRGHRRRQARKRSNCKTASFIRGMGIGKNEKPTYWKRVYTMPGELFRMLLLVLELNYR